MPRERGDHYVAGFVRARVRANQADLRVSQRTAGFCYKICALESLTGETRAISGALRHLCRSPGRDHKWLAGAEFRGHVLNVPLSSVICR